MRCWICGHDVSEAHSRRFEDPIHRESWLIGQWDLQYAKKGDLEALLGNWHRQHAEHEYSSPPAMVGHQWEWQIFGQRPVPCASVDWLFASECERFMSLEEVKQLCRMG